MAEALTPQEIEAARITAFVLSDIAISGPISQALAAAIRRGGPLTWAIQWVVARGPDGVRKGQ